MRFVVKRTDVVFDKGARKRVAEVRKKLLRLIHRTYDAPSKGRQILQDRISGDTLKLTLESMRPVLRLRLVAVVEHHAYGIAVGSQKPLHLPDIRLEMTFDRGGVKLVHLGASPCIST